MIASKNLINSYPHSFIIKFVIQTLVADGIIRNIYFNLPFKTYKTGIFGYL